MTTVAELRKHLDGFPDDMEIVTPGSDDQLGYYYPENIFIEKAVLGYFPSARGNDRKLSERPSVHYPDIPTTEYLIIS